MSFTSLEFLLFFPTVVVLYFTLAHRFRWILLLFASYYFYMCWRPEYLVLIIISTLIDYVAGICMERTPLKPRRRKFLVMSICANLGLLFGFKYFNFFSESVRSICDTFNIFYNVPLFKVLLPVGISFYTFQSMAYAIDVYRGVQKAEKHFGYFALYVAFFPQLVAGPIERARHLIPQLRQEHDVDYQRITDGLKLMTWGFFKKLVIADRLAVIVNQTYNHPVGHTGIVYILATVFFAYQIYCDFSGYSDIAIGAARVMGVELMQNFRRPYAATSVRDFWKRWHISLTTWFKDYLYIPLGGNRVAPRRWHWNILIVFLASGLWHGASWTFIIWGGLHGFYLLCSIWTKDWREMFAEGIGLSRYPGLQKYLKICVTFTLVSFAWIFFRANSLSDAFYVVTHLGSGFGDIFANLSHVGQGIDILGLDTIGVSRSKIIIGLGLIVFLELVQKIPGECDPLAAISKQPLVLRWAVYYASVLSIIIMGQFGQSQFIYFQF